MSIQVSRLLHAGYLLKSKEATLLFDPIFENPFSVNCYAYPSIEFDLTKVQNLKPDAVFISHYHDDHCSLKSLDLLPKSTPIYLFCIYEELFQWIRKLGFSNVYSLQLNSTIQIKDFSITVRPALDRDTDSVFHIESQGLNILNVVDSWIDDDTLKRIAKTKWDLILWPFQTMREVEVLIPEEAEKPVRTLPPEWLDQLKTLNPRIVVPSSCQFIQEEWSWQREFYFPISYQQFANEMELLLPDTKVLRINPGESYLLSEQGIEPIARIDWIKPKGDQNVEYDINEKLKIPTTAEVASHFPALSESETTFVYNYCENELLKKYLQSTYAAAVWCLKIYNHQGFLKEFFYSKDNSRKDPDWITEISIAKLYSALTSGESLSSLYLRIALKPQSSDPMEDPLIEALYSGIFGSYQRSQLNQLYK